METPEEIAAQKKFPYGCGYCVEKREGFVAGIKWQKEQSKTYSKEEVINTIDTLINNALNKYSKNYDEIYCNSMPVQAIRNELLLKFKDKYIKENL